MGSSSALTPYVALMVAPPPNQNGSYYFGAFTSPVFYTQAPYYALLYNVSTPFAGVFFVPPLSQVPYRAPMSTTTPMYPPFLTIPTFYLQSSYVTPYTYPSIVSQTPSALLFYQGGSSS